MEIISINKSEHLISGIVATLNVEDSQGDIIKSLDTLQAAAWDWFQNGEGFNLDHDKDIDVEDARIVESFVTDENPVMKGGNEIPPFSWVITAKISEKLWPIISKCTGLSMQGMAREAE